MGERLPLTPGEFRALAHRVVELATGLLAELPGPGHSPRPRAPR